ncbi:MAG TPA: hypothetical protein PKE40_01505 [Arachnia sp.]|nr:hypothetical protein [Arachnia sp.]HMT85004.1 hypothetical protein [Arachnia sp.]
MRLPKHPAIYEINTAVWLRRLGDERGTSPLRLDEVPGEVWDRLAALRIDAVWLMGVGRRSPAGLAIARANADLMAAMRDALPDLREDDIIGSPYCLREYVVDERFGGDAGLAVARRELAQRGLGLMLGFIPNHVAPDNPWLRTAPELLIRGTEQDLVNRPDSFLRTPDGIFARGRDPYFPAWPDVVQINAFAPALREAHIQVLKAIAERCDGVRCDMAMLVCNEVFARTWGRRAGAPPEQDYWPQVVGAVKATHPHMTFAAEVYWDKEPLLLDQGFDYCYDKRLYDHLRNGDAADVRRHLDAWAGHQDRALRFAENHDEQRATVAFGARARAAAVVTSTLPGARLFHDGQFEGRRIHVPVFLGRGPDEPVDAETAEFYRRLLAALSEMRDPDAQWGLADAEGLPGDDTFRQVLAWQWRQPAGGHLVVVNLGDGDARARIRFDGRWPDDRRAGVRWVFRNLLDNGFSRHDGAALARDGLEVALTPWQPLVLAYEPAP